MSVRSSGPPVRGVLVGQLEGLGAHVLGDAGRGDDDVGAVVARGHPVPGGAVALALPVEGDGDGPHGDEVVPVSPVGGWLLAAGGVNEDGLAFFDFEEVLVVAGRALAAG